ncbi:hypothetical protein [Streptomyces sp. NPDC053720]|uniref:hypothetical protein n=1 Tax=Streptomyces sp. NPDC053720 TaxID=3154855 RepID=UPI00343E487A
MRSSISSAVGGLAAGLELGGQRHQLGRSAREALELVHGEDERGLGGGFSFIVSPWWCGPARDGGFENCCPIAGRR